MVLILWAYDNRLDSACKLHFLVFGENIYFVFKEFFIQIKKLYILYS